MKIMCYCDGFDMDSSCGWSHVGMRINGEAPKKAIERENETGTEVIL
jgi:hypothetical protein